jgi:alpha amylase-like protein/type IX secretion system substrate protein
MIKKFSHILFLLIYAGSLMGQVTISPVFATQKDSITVTYDATQGNKELMGLTQIYAHTGVITNLSNSPTDWRHVQGNWGTADPKVKMKYIGNNLHQISYKIESFYGVPQNEVVSKLAFVFRNANGSKVGRAADGSDIYVDLYGSGFNILIQSPNQQPQFYKITDSIPFHVQASDTAIIRLYNNNSLLTIDTGNSTKATFAASDFGYGKFWLKYIATYNGKDYSDSVYYVVMGPDSVKPPPNGIIDGINITGPDEVVLQLYAPFKDFVYAIGDFNNWEIDPAFRMHRSSDSSRFWVKLSNLDPKKMYRFQYYIDEEGMRVGDIYSELILDPYNDPYIPQDVFPNLPPYPIGKTTQLVTVFQIEEDEYQWKNNAAYKKPERENLLIYELHMRDFLHSHSYQALTDTLNYLQNLGINVIELMPINEFEGNISWGYNPSFYFAPDKYYGTKNALKALIDECHRRNMAVIIDMVLNHSFGQNPQVRMYFDPNAGQWGQPTPENPWFNEKPKHDFNVGYDYNHESPATKLFVERVLKFWIEEYHIDGYRLDLSKGYTQKNTLGNINAWGQYDQSRIDILKHYYDIMIQADSNVFVTLEHFADNSEEKVLSDYGMMLWGNIHWNYKEASLGYPGNLSAVSYKSRGWSNPNLIGYYTSHDEERLMYENLKYGNSSGNYNVRDFETGLKRMELINTFLTLVPGPKLFWEFDELGYDFTINYCENGTINPSCRTSPKPIKWDYATDTLRALLFKVTSALNKLKTDYPVFKTTDFSTQLNNAAKSIHLNNNQMNVTVLGNFDVVSKNINPQFQHTGTWYDYFKGDSVEIDNVSDLIALKPGAYYVYTDVRLPEPDLEPFIPFDYILGIPDVQINPSSLKSTVFPNPAGNQVIFKIETKKTTAASILISDLYGKSMGMIWSGQLNEGLNNISINLANIINQNSGLYIYTIIAENEKSSGRIIFIK